MDDKRYYTEVWYPTKHAIVSKKLETNCVPLSDTMVFGTPCKLMIRAKYILAYWIVGYILLTGRKCADLISRSTITHIESKPFDVLDRPMIKSILISSNFQARIGNGYNSPTDLKCIAFTF